MNNVQLGAALDWLPTKSNKPTCYKRFTAVMAKADACYCHISPTNCFDAAYIGTAR